MYRSIVMVHPFVTIVCTYIHIECLTAFTEPVSFNTMYVFNRSYNLVQCSLAMWTVTITLQVLGWWTSQIRVH